MQKKTIVVGGGMAGIACASRLLEADQDFLLITDILGGRIKYSDEAKVNFGAYFVMGNYAHAKKIVQKNKAINPLKVGFHNSDTERFGVLSWRTLRLLPEFIRFLLAMMEFSRHYETFKKRCLTMPQKDAFAADPYMAGIFSEPASQFIRERGYTRAAADYVSKFAYACTGADPDRMTAQDYLNVSMALILPIHQIEFDRKAMAHLLGEHLVTDTITQVEQKDGRIVLSGKSGTSYQAEHVVMATPASVTQDLLELKTIREASKIFVFHVKAQLKPNLRKYAINLFPYASKIMLTAVQSDGTYLIYSREKAVDLNQVCDSYELLASVDWEKAMYVYGSAFMEQTFGDGIYIAGDHNGLGLEPSAISGIYAANQILQKAAGH